MSPKRSSSDKAQKLPLLAGAKRVINKLKNSSEAVPKGGRRSIPVSDTAVSERTTFCGAPSTSLYLDQMGDVRACCQNAEYPLGNITEASLSEIWHGERTAALREALSKRDLTLGCQFCRWQLAEDNESLVYARTFDHLELPNGRPVWPQQLELSLSNSCNLQCVMCNGEWSSSIRTHREGLPPLPVVYDEAFFADLAEFLPHLQIVKMLGGEPFLGHESLRVLDMLVEAGLTPELHVTTNGTQWSPRVERIMERLPMHVILSLDGCDAETYEAIRQGSDFELVMENLERFQGYAARHGTEVHLAHCLMTNNWHRFADFLRFADERDLPVGVNTVTSPTELSLHQLHPDRLDEVVAQMDAMNDQVLSDLGRNRDVWTDQLDRLHHRQKALADFTDVSYYLGREILGVPWRRRPDGRDHLSEARELRSTIPGAVDGPVLVVDDSEIITAVEPANDAVLLGVDLSELVGRHAAELFGAFGMLHGNGSPAVINDDRDLQHWKIAFDGATGLALDAIMAPTVDHAGVATSVHIFLAGRVSTPSAVSENDGLRVISVAAESNAKAREEAEADEGDVLHEWLEGLADDSGVHLLLLDNEGTVLSVGPNESDVLGIDLSGLVGGSVIELIEAFVPVFGELKDRHELSLPSGSPAGSRVERVEFAGTDGTPEYLLVAMENGITTPVGRPGMRVLLGRRALDSSS